MRLKKAVLTAITTLLVAAVAISSPRSTGDEVPPAVRKLEEWTQRCQKRPHLLGDDYAVELRSLLARTRAIARASFEGQRVVAIAVLDVYGAGIRLTDSLDSKRAAEGEQLKQMAEFELSMSLDRPLVRWLAKDVLVSPDRHPEERRAACALVLARKDDPGLTMALATCAREDEGIVREAAVWSLAGRQLDSVHTMCLRLLQKEDFEAQSAIFPALEYHFQHSRLALESPVNAGLFEYVRTHIGLPDWRLAVHSINVSKALETSIVVPLLIDAFDLWVERANAGEPVRRVLNDLVESLQQRSGMRLGAHPGRWRTWWKGVQAGQVPVHDSGSDQGMTEASFFGLRPLTDRVVFLIDHSGSMDARIAPRDGRTASSDWTRYEEAVAQMISLLERMGPRTRFNVVLFDDTPERWQERLQGATPGRLKAARTWLLSRHPKGGTFLRQGFEAAIGLKRGGKIDLDKTEADTVIVLCDGQTAEGSAWVLPLLKRTLSQSRWIVHCVQLGSFGDDTLEILAETTGGEHVRL
ncbi:MAG: hypothetical protein ACI8QZ_001135 [Chlamydiales bacterium]|jgi:hypothetical protein